MKALLIYSIILSLLSSYFLKRSLIFTPNSQIFTLISFLCLFFSLPVFEHLEAASARRPHVAHACCVIKKGSSIRGRSGSEIILCRCPQNYSGTCFNAPISDLNPIPSPYPCPTGDWVDKICGSYRSMILLLRFQYNR